ncbi:MAG: hypothetical protein KGL39_19770 [Patescibacteria group bacterium]|nr:hypothetical protein [Patescibacteria group bacterium]
MAKVKFVIVGGGAQLGLKLGKNERPPDFYQLDLGALQLEDKAIIGVLEGVKKQTGFSEKCQAWKKEHGRDGWILVSEKAGIAKMSFGDVSAEDQPETKKAKEDEDEDPKE